MSGYDLSRFIGLTQTQKIEMLCGICLAIFKRPVDTICGHTFCFDCINGWFNSYNNSCPECRHNMSPVFPSNIPFTESTKRFQNLINRFLIKCDFEENGCKEVIELGELNTHLDKCPFNKSKKGSKSIEWIQMKGSDEPRSDAVIGGHDLNEEPLYVGRALESRDLICGKIVSTHHCCYVCYNGLEFSHQNFEVLTNPHNCELKWIPASHGSIPLNAIEGGKQSNGEIVYIGRVQHLQSLTIGKVHPSHRVIYIPFAGKEINYKNYEVLCL